MTEKQEKYKTLSRRLAHELKNPLGGVRGAAMLLERELADPSLKEYTRIIVDEADRIQTSLNANIVSEDNESILRSIEFSPEHKQAGISLLNYFGEVIQQRYPNDTVTFRIEQSGNFVSLIVMADGAQLERIDRLLSEYGAVIEGLRPVDSFLQNPLHATQLKQKLEMAALELKMTKELYQTHSVVQNARVDQLEAQVTSLTKMMGRALAIQPSMADVIHLLERESGKDEQIATALRIVTQNLVHTPQPENEQKIEEAFSLVQRARPGLFSEIKDIAKETVGGAAGNLAASWIMTLINSLPK